MRAASFAATMERVDRVRPIPGSHDNLVRETGVTCKVTLLDGPSMPRTVEVTEWGPNYYECERQALSKALRAMAAAVEVLP